MPSVKMIEYRKSIGLYGQPREEMIVELGYGAMVYLFQCFHEECTTEGGVYTWANGSAMKVFPGATIDSHMIDRCLEWTGLTIEQTAMHAKASFAASMLGHKGGSATGGNKPAAAKARNAKRKLEGKNEGGRPKKA